MTHKAYGPYEKYLKRPLGLFFSVISFVTLFPVILLIAFLVKIKIGSPVLFVQERPGLNGKVFKLYKFRTMTNQKDENGILLSDNQRITKFGKKLRSTSLDELPELLNVIKGDMAFVGPRPLLVQYLSRYNEYQMRRHEVRPGFTGLAQVHGRNSIGWDEKFDWDIKYVDRITFFLDIKILLSTIRTVISRKGISSEGEISMPEFLGNPDNQRETKKD